MRKKEKSNGDNGSTKAKWVKKVFIIAFGLSVFFSFISENIMTKVSIVASFIILMVIIGIGILFDIIGIAVTSAKEVPFHAMAADKIPGGKEAVKLIKNADIVSNFCNDVVGDISGIISGAAGATIVIRMALLANDINEMFLSIFMTGIISTLTIGGKAIGKGIALNNSKSVVYSVALFLNVLKERFKIDILPSNGHREGASKK